MYHSRLTARLQGRSRDYMFLRFQLLIRSFLFRLRALFFLNVDEHSCSCGDECTCVHEAAAEGCGTTATCC